MSVDPFAPKFPKSVVQKYFGSKSSAKDAMRLKKENPGLYDEMRISAEQDHGLLGERSYFRPQDRPADPNAPRAFSTEEIRARAVFPESECLRLLKETGSVHNATNLLKSDPDAYRLFKLASVSYGLLPPSTVIPAPQPKPAPVDSSVAIGDELADQLNLPRGYRAQNNDELQKIITIASEVKAAKAAGEAGATTNA